VVKEGAQRLPPLLAGGLDVVFIGTAPGADSLRLGHYYANPGNSFYADLVLTGFTPARLVPAEFRHLLDFGIGLDDVYQEPDELQERIERASPRAVCFNSKAALTGFTRRRRIPAGAWRGEGAARYASLAEITWAVDDSSGAARGFRALRHEGLRELRNRVQRGA